ncbi:hypothetical protein D9757_000521 [Collybiopsis confluens]|uniref:N-acetyltransferase domain-containing protein n=1 Tax=Collybiopsis confluens TaxID=2823264 RepID=A0A8H5I1C7_9AGAR|nr:hypothetical protein D9757_000521 [Collybiopsis confluens]
MSAYGAIERSSATASPLPSTVWSTRSPDEHVTVHHLREASADPDLVQYLANVFIQELHEGRTYPQEGASFDSVAFKNYFLAQDLFVGIATTLAARGHVESGADSDVVETSLRIDEARDGRSWDECVVGCYYVKPNYPGRSSHICNAGFIVPVTRRKGGYGLILGKSYVHYAPKLGYKASVFNLVYANNEASVRIWERLGFTKAGCIPQAGRLRRANGEGEEYVDAWVIYKNFVKDGLNGSTPV